MQPALKLCKIPNWYAKDCEKLFFADYVFKNDCELFQHSAPSTQVRVNYQENCLQRKLEDF